MAAMEERLLEQRYPCQQIEVSEVNSKAGKTKESGIEKGVRNHCFPVPSSSALVLAISHPSFTPPQLTAVNSNNGSCHLVLLTRREICSENIESFN